MLATGCAASTDGSDDPTADTDGDAQDEVISSTEPLSMPKPMLTFLRTQDWGSHHLQWHTVRQWDRLGPSDQAWAKRQGWARADLMEGAKGNGLEFLAMHRVMIRTLTAKFPKNADLFTGWEQPPTDNADKADPASVKADPPAGPPAFGPYAVALSPSGARVAVSNRDAKELRFLDVARASMESLVVPLLGSPYFSAWSGHGARVFVPTRGLDALSAVDAATGAVLRTKVFDVATCAQPLEAIVAADPATVFVVCEGLADVPGAVLTVDATTLEVRARSEVGMSPGRSFLGRGR